MKGPWSSGGRRRRFSILRKVSPGGIKSSASKRGRGKKQGAGPCVGPGEARDDEVGDRRAPASAWDTLPEVLLQQVLRHVLASQPGWPGRKAVFALCGACRSWRSAGTQTMFEDLWRGPPSQAFPIMHPAQLFLMSPRPVEGGLVKCYIKREDISGGPGGPHCRFLLYLGDHAQARGAKFLLSAVQHSWQRVLLYTSRADWSAPCARLVSNLIGTHHRLLAGRGMSFPSVPSSAGISLPEGENLGGVSYKLRMKGMMRPRRLTVLIPHPILPHLPSHASLLCRFSLDHNRFKRTSLSHLDQAFEHRVHFGMEGNAESEHALLRSERRCRGQSHPAGVFDNLDCEERWRALKLTNKPPHWNDGLRCWCLNFKGRVKLASVKNFQLMCSNDTAGRIVMQFGKVDTDTFIMDYNPEIITGLQAFSVALTSFEGRLLL
ncbi:unnamed protein product [Ostreobium quekettii]|uniref:Tubby C-terminal domain-containing protein n=1 Tax=Ostreobium quekettii TaxID=121088 RepID=A0A8S1JDS0_9CHLO|nr:unnamed protein product [Ostreobium quekettii]|eukprot:evm.model.scf_3858.1 EVM.evm.TU.scf_3858.1   scf_3858:4230-9569(-)